METLLEVAAVVPPVRSFEWAEKVGATAERVAEKSLVTSALAAVAAESYSTNSIVTPLN